MVIEIISIANGIIFVNFTWEAPAALAISGEMHYTILVCPGCGLLFLLAEYAWNRRPRKSAGRRIIDTGGVTVGIG